MLLFDLCEETRTPTGLLIQAVMEAVGKAKKLPMGWKAVARGLSPTEKEKMRSDTAQRLVDIFRRLPDDKEFEAAARAGQAKKGWYAYSAKALMETFGPDTPRFAALLASLSPQVSVTENLRNAFKFWTLWLEAGRPNDPKALNEIGKEAVGLRWEGGLTKDAMGNVKETKGMGWKPNVLRAMTAEEPEKVVLSSGGSKDNPLVGKVDSFRANLLGDLSRVTNDAWMAHFAEIDQDLFSSKAGYLAMTAKIRRVANKMGWSPAEVQETVWSFFKALHEKQSAEDRGQKTLEKMTHSDVNDASDFADLMLNDKEVKDALQKLRDRGHVGEPTPGLRDGGQDPASSPQSAAASRGLAGSLARVADRAERLKHQQDAQELATRGYHFPNATDIKFGRAHVTFTLTDPREIAEWKEKPRKADDAYSVFLGRRDGQWDRISGVTHGVPTVADHGNKVTITLPFRERQQVKPVEIDPEKWREVERKKAEKANRFKDALQPA